MNRTKALWRHTLDVRWEVTAIAADGSASSAVRVLCDGHTRRELERLGEPGVLAFAVPGADLVASARVRIAPTSRACEACKIPGSARRRAKPSRRGVRPNDVEALRSRDAQGSPRSAVRAHDGVPSERVPTGGAEAWNRYVDEKSGAPSAPPPTEHRSPRVAAREAVRSVALKPGSSPEPEGKPSPACARGAPARVTPPLTPEGPAARPRFDVHAPSIPNS